MFKPSKPFEIAHDGEHYGNMGKYSQFVRELINAQFQISGVYCYIYRLEGTHDQKRDELGVLVDEHGSEKSETAVDSFLGIQDPILGENRDRRYNFDEIPRLKGVFQMSPSEMELLRFGFKSNETLSVEFSQATVETELGRRFVQGDVIEFPHMREVGPDGRVGNRWYEVKDISWSIGGYDPAYQRHIVGVILQPIRHQQEFLDLFNNVKDEYGNTLADQLSNEKSMMAVTDAIQKKAGEHASTTWWDTTIMWLDPNDPDGKPCQFVDDGKPNDGSPVMQGQSFPANAKEGEWFLRIDLYPNRLYRFQKSRWVLKEIDHKRDWQPYNWVAPLREHMSDRSDADRSRPWKLVSIHDVITDRENRSDPTGEKS